MKRRTISTVAIGKRILIYFLLIVAGTAAGLAAFELYARIALWRQPAWPDRWTFRATQPPPYAGASYFSQAFIQEAAHSVGGLFPRGKNQLVSPDFRGRWSNVRDGRRVTTDQPSTFHNRIYLFGGSCVFSQEVPDEFTIASYLQRRVNQALPGRFRVENMGIIALTTVQQVESLKTVKLAPGDKVIFYDGANDVTYGVYYLVPLGLGPGRDLSIVRQMSPMEKIVLERFSEWKPRLASLRLLQGRIDLRPPSHLLDAATVKVLLDLLGRQRTSTLLETDAMVKDAGGEFFSFLQPNIFDLPSQTAYRESIIRNPLSTPPGLELAFRPATPVMARVVRWLKTAGVRAASFSGVLTSISKSEEVYLDYAHVNHRANEVIANEVFQQVFHTTWAAAEPGAGSALRAKLGSFEPEALPAPRGRRWNCEFFRTGQRIYAVPSKYGHVWWDGVDVAALPGVVTGATVEEVTSHVQPIPIQTH